MLSTEQLAALAVSILGTITAVARWAWVQGKKEAGDAPSAATPLCQYPPELSSKIDRLTWAVDEMRKDLRDIERGIK
ncbi:hypothetical protein SAMN06273572_10261 [Monaibacterium marinum]|uniref:Uncharacterized protein n=1 Tax=Pontivivens marinum TaxID=1690039 RepID=A0A2C9CQD3_9RHOB|nr:hypothetical protein [Monaibacterium marinum]SOH93385.1 hypothetical protein SAMN06273572_10261 [Monaibacterium marinum]